MSETKFKKLNIGDTFYVYGEYNKIDQYEKISDGYAEQVLTASTKWFEDDIDVYVD